MKSFFIKIINTFLIPKIFYKNFYKNFTINYLKENKYKFKNENFILKIIRKLLFLPNFKEIVEWLEGSDIQYRNFNDFKKLRPQIDIHLFKQIQQIDNSRNFKILDLGCNSGKHLRFLWKMGFRKLYGVDIMEGAIKYFKKKYSKNYPGISLNHDLMQNYLNRSFKNNYDLVYTVGSTIEEVHPSYDVIKEICRVSKKYVIFLIHEHDHPYPRFYKYELQKNGFKIVNTIYNIGFNNKKSTNISLLCAKKLNET